MSRNTKVLSKFYLLLPLYLHITFTIRVAFVIKLTPLSTCKDALMGKFDPGVFVISKWYYLMKLSVANAILGFPNLYKLFKTQLMQLNFYSFSAKFMWHIL